MSNSDIEARLLTIRSMAGFDRTVWWLTFYLTADPASLNMMAQRLADYDAENLDDADGGFLYPKIPVPNDPQRIMTMISEIEQISVSCSVTIIQVDADTSADVTLSRFAEIARY